MNNARAGVSGEGPDHKIISFCRLYLEKEHTLIFFSLFLNFTLKNMDIIEFEGKVESPICQWVIPRTNL